MNVIETIIFAVFAIAFFGAFLGGFYYLISKVFGVQFTSKYNYHNQVQSNKLRHRQIVTDLAEVDHETIELAKDRLRKKFFAHTSDNIVEEVLKIQLERGGQNDFIPDLTTKRDYELLNGHIYMMAVYCCYYNGITTYLKFLSKREGIIAFSRGQPNNENIDTWFNEINGNVIKFEFKYERKDVIRFEIYYGRKYGYDIFLKNAEQLNVARWVPLGETITKLNFVLCS
jgi:hypothetical protein